MRLYVLGFLTLLLLVNEPNSANGICNISKNGTHAKCQHIEDIKNITTNELKDLKIFHIDKYLSVDSFNNLTNLRNLDLSNGKLRKLKTGLFLNLRELQSLDLSNNYLHNFDAGTFDGLLNLQYLNLHGNEFKRIPNNIDMKNLKHLDLSNNKLICDCKTLKERDNLHLHGVNITNETLCSSPGYLTDVSIHELDRHGICRFEQDDDMLMDEPVTDTDESSGQVIDGDAYDKITDTDIADDEKTIKSESTTLTNEKKQDTTTTIITEIPVKLETTVTSQNDKMDSSENIKNSTPITTTTKLFEKIIEEGSGSAEDDDGSGIEGSGIGIVPPIDWSNVVETTSDNSEISESPKPTESPSWSWSIFDIFATKSPDNTSTSSTESTIVSTTIDDINLAQDDFLPVSTTKSPELTTTIINNDIDKAVLVNVNNENSKIRVNDNEKIEIIDDTNELPDASLAMQTKKGFGSYIILGVLLIVLVSLIGFAAYRGDFCNNKNNNDKRNIRNPDLGDIENGTELKDLTKSLIDDNTTIQPMITNKNGNKHETMPLVSNDNHNDDDKFNNKNINEPIAKYIGNVGDSNVDPVKPPRKSYSPNEQDNDTNNYVNEQSLKQKNDKDILVNGKHDRDSLSSGSLSNQLNNQSSPGAQRVKITLQDNPDSVPKTPLLITKIKGGENLVKTSP